MALAEVLANIKKRVEEEADPAKLPVSMQCFSLKSPEMKQASSMRK